MNKDSFVNSFQSRIQWVSNLLYDVAPWMALSATALSMSLASSAIQKLSEKFVFGIGTVLKQEEIYPNIFYIVVFIISISWLYSLRRHLFKARTQGMHNVDNPEHREHLVLFLSNIHEKQLGNYTEQLIPNGLVLENAGLQSLDKDLASIEEHKKSNRPWAWEMTLRAIRHHIGNVESPTLKTITVICSHESIKQFPQYGAILGNYLKNTNITLKLLAKKNGSHCWETYNGSQKNHSLNGYDFEDFDELTSALHWYLKQRRKNKVK